MGIISTLSTGSSMGRVYREADKCQAQGLTAERVYMPHHPHNNYCIVLVMPRARLTVSCYPCLLLIRSPTIHIHAKLIIILPMQIITEPSTCITSYRKHFGRGETDKAEVTRLIKTLMKHLAVTTLSEDKHNKSRHANRW